MVKKLNRAAALATGLSLVAVLSACGGGGSGDSGSVNNGLVANEFELPNLVVQNGETQLGERIGVKPTFPARRVLAEGTGNTIEFGDPVVLRYSMYSWTSGELVESTDSFDEPLTIRAGVSEGVPQFLSDSLLGRKVGDTIQVVFETGMDDLPSYLDASDAYVVVVDLI